MSKLNLQEKQTKGLTTSNLGKDVVQQKFMTILPCMFGEAGVKIDSTTLGNCW